MELHLNTGDMAPDFTLKDQDGKTHSLKDYRGKPLMIYFYPKASTPGCTTQSCNVRDARDDFSSLGCAVLGVSPDKEGAQKKFDEKHGLGFPLLCDTETAMAEAYGVWGEKKMYGKSYMGIIRSAFLVDGEGKIAGTWYKVSPKDTVPEVMKVLESL
ncbi:MAG: thioredoxin-dependent thiol peroxidase [Spirochaetales bacterium]|nr:thioredoxin-dependent thiol peroxidase [Spirochaetales bacterium]